MFPNSKHNMKSNVEHLSIRAEELYTEIIYFCKQNMNNTSYILAHFVNEVLLGRVYNNEIQFYGNVKFDENYLLEARIFNEDSELYIWKNENGFEGRKRIDSQEQGDSQCFEMKYAIWGQKAVAADDNWILLEEKERGFKIFIPTTSKVKNGAKVFYKTRNYFHYDKDGMIQFEDARLCSLLDEQGNLLQVV